MRRRVMMGRKKIADWNKAQIGDIVYAIGSNTLNYVSPSKYKRGAIGFICGIINNKRYVVAPNTFVSVFGVDTALDLPTGYNDDGKGNCAKLSSLVENQLEKWPIVKIYQDYAPYGTKKGDWFLPAYNQYSLLYRNRGVIKSSAVIAGINTDLDSNSNSATPYPAWWVSSSYGGYASDRNQHFFYGYGFDGSGSWRMIPDEVQRFALMMQIEW